MSRKSACIVAAVLLISVGFGVTSLRAQNAQGTVLGHIQDSSGAAVPNARVTLLNEGTGISVAFVTEATGDYVFVKQTPRAYDVTVEAQGFKTASTKGLVLHVDQTLRQDFTLEVGSVSQQVTVSAKASMLQTDNATVGQIVGDRTLSALPLNGRDYTTLIAMNAGVVQPAGGIQSGVFDLHGLNTTWSASSINGQRPSSISYLVDGISDSDLFFSKSISLISADSVEEFKLQNGLYSAEYGSGSAQVNVAIKSGTNQLHGSAYDYVENAALQPASPVTAALNAMNNTHFPVAAALVQNQFGFTLGGPMVLPKIYNGRNKTFWFAGYEGGRKVSGSTSPGYGQVPTAGERSGDFSDWPYPIYDPSTTGTAPVTATDPTGRTQYAGNKLTSISPMAQKWLSYFPKSNVNCQMPCSNFVYVVKSPVTTDTVNGRIDHDLSSRDRLIGTVIVSRDIQSSPSPLPASGSVAYARTRTGGLEYSHNFSSNSINSLRVGYNREFYHNGAITSFGPNLSAQLGFSNTTPDPAFWGLPGASIAGGYAAPGNGNNGYTQTENIFQYADNYTLIHGKHTFTMGVDVRRYQIKDVDGFTANGSLGFTGAYTASDPSTAGRPGPTSGNGFADFLLGYPFSYIAPLPLASDVYDVRSTTWSFFFQDDYRITPRLTLNLGLRYELPASFHSLGDDGAVPNLSSPGGGLLWASKSYTELLASAPGASTYYQCCVTNHLVPPDRRDWAPRIGLAWRPLPNNNKLVIRTGYGIFYDTYNRFYDLTGFDSDLLSLLVANPYYPAATGMESASPLATNTLWLPPLKVTPTSVPPPWQFNIETPWPANKTPYNQQWTFDGQYEFSNNLMLDVGYVGARALRLPFGYFWNQAVAPRVAGDPCNNILDRSLATGGNAACASDPNFQPVDERAPYPNFSSGIQADSNSLLWSNYNALQVRLEKRYSQGLQFGANYTWSRTFDLISEIASFSGVSNEVQNVHNLAAEYGPSAFDSPQRLVLNYIYDVPVGKGRKWNLGVANLLLGGWQTSGIINFTSGMPFGVYCCPRRTPVDQMGTGFADPWRPNLVGNPREGAQTDWAWFDASAFATPALGTFGNLGRNVLRSPAVRSGNLSFMKDFRITERHTIRYRLDIFNVFSGRHAGPIFPDSRMSDSPANCTPGPSGNCRFTSLVPLNGLGDLNLWSPRVLQMSLRYSF